MRYQDESKMLCYLSNRQLNLPKNAAKERFEDLSLLDIFEKVKEELEELEFEFQRDKLNLDFVYSEIGDVAACLVGLLAFVNDKYTRGELWTRN